MIESYEDVWDKLTEEEKRELGRELEKAFQEEFDREIIRMIREKKEKDNAN